MAMDYDKVNEILIKRLDKELNDYRTEVKSHTAEEVYNRYWEIKTHEGLYCAIQGAINDGTLDDEEKEILIRQPEGQLLSNMYWELLDDDGYDSDEIDNILESLRYGEGFENMKDDMVSLKSLTASYPELNNDKNEGNSK